MKTTKTGPKAKFITFEGGDGSGKSSAIQYARNYLTELGHPVVTCRQPGTTVLGNQLREILNYQDPSVEPIEPTVQCLLYLAGFKQLENVTIRPALKEGIFVLCDRFYHTTLAYQVAGENLHERTLNALLKQTKLIPPDFTFFLDVDPETGLTRKRNQEADKHAKDYYEKKDLEFHKRIREAYQFLGNKETLNNAGVLLQTTNLAPTEVEQHIKKILGEIL